MTDEELFERYRHLLDEGDGGYLCDTVARKAVLPFIAAVRETSGWQPIETAPKDGTRVLLYDQFEREEGHAQFVGAWSNKWFTIPGAFGKKPTHWMPLPEPPQ